MDNDEDLIVVDDVDDSLPPATPKAPVPGPSHDSRPPPTTGIRSALRRRKTPPSYAEQMDDESPERGERKTRSSTYRSIGSRSFQPKLKLKLSEKAAAQAPGMSFLGAFDRELDSDEEDLVFEEQFVLRMPAGEDCEKLRKMVTSREISPDVWFKFKDSRRAVFHIGNNLYSAKLVDLPCIIESQKTLDNKQMFKVADICQMLVVENPIPSEEATTSQQTFNIDEFIWPHGVTPPLHHVRKRRFRKRISRRVCHPVACKTIETVEQEVERLLEADADADEVKYDVFDNVNPDASDSEFLEMGGPAEPQTPGFGGSEAGDAPTPGGEGYEEGESMEATRREGDEDGEEGEEDIDEDLAAELDLALGDEDGEDEGDEEDDDEDDDESEEEDDDEDDEEVQAKKLLNEEIRDLEAAVAKKGMEIASSANPLIRRRFEEALRKLQADLDTKRAQRDELKEKRRLQKEGKAPDGGDDGDDEDEGEDDNALQGDDLFGESQEVGMDIG
ncbi:hypothetical protein EIP86_004274 [Pleurotus ostreatoroseus]|nr:hypothetical protein EIP86_004274 [Pleurotus ostreatoroseus]